MDHWDVYVPVSFCKLLNEPADRMVKKTHEQDFQTILHSIACLFTEYWHVVSKIKKTGPKNQKYQRSFYVFSVFVSGPFILLVSRLGQSDSSMFWNMLKCSQKHEPCKVLTQSPEPVRLPAQQFKNQNESPNCLLLNALWIVCRIWMV